MRKITKIKRSIRAISPVIATLLMIAIAVIASLIVYAWVIGYIGSGTTKASNSMLIQSTSHTPDNFIVVYVQNVGQGTLQLQQTQSTYVNSILKSIRGSDPTISAGMVTFSPDATASLKIDYPYTKNEKLTIKITATDGTFAEYTTTTSSETTSGTFPDYVSPTPVGQTPTPTPVGQTPTPTPVGQTPTPTPVGQTPTPTPVGQTPTPTPVGQTPTPTPVGQTPTPTPSQTTVHITFAVNPVGSGTTTPSGSQTYNYGQTVNIQANAAAGYTFSSWTYNGIITVNNPTTSSTTAAMLGDGTITANFIASSGNKLVFTQGTNQILAKNVGSAEIRVQRQTSTGSVITGTTTSVSLTTTSSGGKFYSNAACTTEITTFLTIPSAGTASFWYKDSTTGTPTITAAATSFASAQTTFNVNVLYSNFDGSNWLSGWTTGTQPPWYQSAVGEGVDGTQAAKSDSTNYLGGNDGPFTSDVSDTSSGNTMTDNIRL